MPHLSQALRLPAFLVSALSVIPLLAGVLVIAPASPASAVPATPPVAGRGGWDAVCWGYAGCNDAGYPNGGYAQVNQKMYWRMYAGHNCTNYIAYRMIRAGASTERPWSGSGNASNWGPANRSLTNMTPTVGAVAWWGANAPPVGSSGHVAYVERVISSSEILVSEDSYGGDFDWRRVRKSAGGWPTGFVHFTDATLSARSAPVVSGTAQVGLPLSATSGSWTPAATTYAYQWLADGVPVAGARAATFTPTVDQRARSMSVTVTATKPGYTATSATSVVTGRVAQGAMTTTRQPTVTGTPALHEILSVRPATWSPSSTQTRLNWYADGQMIRGAKADTLRLGRDQIGRKITAVVVGKTPGYASSHLTSAPLGPVKPGTITVSEPFTVQGEPRVGRRLTATPGTVTPTDAVVSYAWLRDGVEVPGATGATYDLGPDDVGTQPSVRVSLSRQAYRSTTLEAPGPGIVTTASTTQLRAEGRSRRAVMHVQVAAQGVASPGGSVTFTIGSRTHTVDLVDGGAATTFRALAVRRWDATATYSGTSQVRSSRSHTAVDVPR